MAVRASCISIVDLLQVSNCKSPSHRWQLYKELSRHVSIDIYGGCGPNKCKRTRQSTSNTCMEQLGRKYKFYLAFENALCKDYLTEKSYEPLRYNLIPIVYGLGNYTQALPKGSFINVMDYSSMKELGQYLRSFTKDEKGKRRFEKYFEWRKTHSIMGAREAYIKSWCRLCEKLHEPLSFKVYEDIVSWWNRTGTCVDANKVLKQWRL